MARRNNSVEKVEIENGGLQMKKKKQDPATSDQWDESREEWEADKKRALAKPRASKPKLIRLPGCTPHCTGHVK